MKGGFFCAINMARQTVGAILQHISATVNQDPTQPTDGGADFLLWLQFINRAQIEWAEAFDWEVLIKTFKPPISGTSQATIPLPQDFRKLAGPVKNWSTGVTGGEDWAEELPERISTRNINSDKFFLVAGDISNGMNLLWYPATLASGASITIPYYSMPTSLASATQYPVIPDSEFLVNRTIGYVLEARSDPRYQDQERKARERLLEMIENSSVAKYNSYVNPIKIFSTENRKGFRMGRN